MQSTYRCAEGRISLCRKAANLILCFQATAVIKSELRNYLDVIVVSTKGHIVNGEILPRHLASMTGGGEL